MRPKFEAAAASTITSWTSKNNGWIWYFVGVFVLAIVATGITVRYNFAMQLKPEMLETAQALWIEKGPRDYLLAYKISTVSRETGAHEAHYLVKVKDGRAYEAKVDGIEQEPDRMVWYGMPKLFYYIQGFLDKDAEPGKPKVYARAVFDPETGALLRYIRSVMTTGDRVEINVAPLKSE